MKKRIILATVVVSLVGVGVPAMARPPASASKASRGGSGIGRANPVNRNHADNGNAAGQQRQERDSGWSSANQTTRNGTVSNGHAGYTTSGHTVTTGSTTTRAARPGPNSNGVVTTTRRTPATTRPGASNNGAVATTSSRTPAAGQSPPRQIQTTPKLGPSNRDALSQLTNQTLIGVGAGLPPGDLGRQAILDVLQGNTLTTAEANRLRQIMMNNATPTQAAAIASALQANATRTQAAAMQNQLAQLVAGKQGNTSAGKAGDLLSGLGNVLGGLGGIGGGGNGGGSGGGDGGSGDGGGSAAADATPVPAETESTATPQAGASSDDSKAAEESAPLTKFDRRYLRVKNNTKEKLDVFVQYETITDTKGWMWFPKAPGQDQAVTYTLASGQELDLAHDDWTVNARRVRLGPREKAAPSTASSRTATCGWSIRPTANVPIRLRSAKPSPSRSPTNGSGRA